MFVEYLGMRCHYQTELYLFLGYRIIKLDCGKFLAINCGFSLTE